MKYVIYDNGFGDVHVLKLREQSQGIPVYEHYRKADFDKAQEIVRRAEGKREIGRVP